MKPFFLISAFVCIIFSKLSSQTTYTLSSSNTINLNVVLNQNSASKIYVTNTGNSKIVLEWKKISVNIPTDWIYSSCDASACYGGVPNGPITMDTIAAGAQGYVGIDVEPITTIGNGVVKLYVYQVGFENQGDTVTWNISSATVGINELLNEKSISVFPNPTYDYLQIKSEKQTINNAYIVDVSGKKIKTIDIKNKTNTITVSELSSGIYYIIYETPKGVVKKQFVKSN